VGGSYFIFRTSWIYGLRGKNFLLTVQRLAREREELRIVADQIGSPTWCRNIAEATAQIMFRMIVCPDLKEEASGLYHLSADGQTSWHGFAEAIASVLRKYDDLVVKHILAIATHEYPQPAERPEFSVLSNKKVYDMFSIQMPDWSEALNLCCT
jgi:dTDP-4-dehydrorhamnose reductase